MFKKSKKGLFNQDVTPFSSPSNELEEESEPLSFSPPLQEHFLHSNPRSFAEEPEVIIGEDVTIKGEIVYSSTLLIDGTFEGTIKTEGKLIVGPKGAVKSNVSLEEAYISGKVEGDILVKTKLVLKYPAEIYGNITAPSVSIEEGVTIVGQLCITPDKAS